MSKITNKRIKTIKDYVSSFYSVSIFDGESRFIGSDSKAITHINLDSYISFDLFNYGDYTGYLLNKSNCVAMEQLYPDYFNADLIKYNYEGYSTEYIIISVKLLLKESFREFLTGIQDYPVIDENLCSQMEVEGESYYFNDYLIRELLHDISIIFDNYDLCNRYESLEPIIKQGIIDDYSNGLIELNEEQGNDYYFRNQTNYVKDKADLYITRLDTIILDIAI